MTGEDEDGDCQNGCREGDKPIPVFERGFWRECEDAVDEAGHAAAAGWRGKIIEVLEEGAAESAVVEMAGDVEG